MDKEIIELLNRIDFRLDKVDSRLDNIDNKLDEHTQILRVLEHSAEVNRAEHDR